MSRSSTSTSIRSQLNLKDIDVDSKYEIYHDDLADEFDAARKSFSSLSRGTSESEHLGKPIQQVDSIFKIITIFLRWTEKIQNNRRARNSF
ncbi:uncharacterized protein L201_007033 [Kwoniella dendrophila CBS 6074]|uniref:Uncharacterized protein n=1 Tax=Kwoniella dendrophila CBS 6074 TaxID=1295534 RepID=A0AAX4K4M6_9TREE